jgi:hypothetical protein
MLASHGRLHEVTQVILNPSEEPYFNVISTMSNKEDVKVRGQTHIEGCFGTGSQRGSRSATQLLEVSLRLASARALCHPG